MALKKPKPLDRNALMSYAAQTLAARALSVAELQTRLRRRAENPNDIDEVIAHMKEYGYLSDQRFANAYTEWRRDNQGFGKARVLRDLLSRKIAPELAKEAVEDAFEEVDETKMVEAFLARKYRGKDLGTLLKEEKYLASAYRRLRTAGFSAGTSIRVLKRYAAQAEQLEGMEEPTGEAEA